VPWNFTLSVILPKSQDGWALQWEAGFVGNFRIGSPISVRPYQPDKPINANSNQGFGHITGVPDTINLSTLRERITGPWVDNAEPPNLVERVGWIVRSDMMTPEGAAFFLQNRFIIANWETLKTVIWSLEHGRTALDTDFI
jgi:hypothetical protein